MGIDMESRETEDWIEYIVDKINMFYAGRQVIIWGSYQVSEDIRTKLKEKYGIHISFCVDRDVKKIDNTKVFPTDVLCGKASEYYVVIPIAFYQSVKDELMRGGYKKEKDYFYFCDCMVNNQEDYYEDRHGNKVIGRHEGIKLVFSGFYSQIQIGENVHFSNVSLYIHSNASVFIGDDSCIENLDMQIGKCVCIEMMEGTTIDGNSYSKESWVLGHDSRLKIGKCVCFGNIGMNIHSNAEVLIGNSSCIRNLSIQIGRCAEVELQERVKIEGNAWGGGKSEWSIGQESEFKVGSDSYFSDGIIYLFKNTVLRIGKTFSIGKNYRIDVLPYTEILIGDDCLFSWDIGMMSSDSHSIFDVTTGTNINSTEKIHKTRKIIIGNHVWIGMRVVVLYNTEIHDGSIVGASSLVKSIIPNNCIAAGVPARVVRRNVAWCVENCSDNIMECEKKYVNYTI